MLLYCVILAMLFFNIINFFNIVEMHRKCWHCKKEWFLVSVIILVVWVSSFYGAGISGGFSFNIIVFSLTGCLGFAFHKEVDREKILLASVIAFLILIFALWKLYICGFEIIQVLGLITSFVAGVSIYLYVKYSFALSEKAGLSATQILATRYYIMIIFLLFIIPKNSVDITLKAADLYLYLSILAISVVSFIIPLFLVQKGIIKSGVDMHVMIMAFIPFFTSIIEVLFGDNFDTTEIVFSVILACILLYDKRYKLIETLHKPTRET